METIRINLQKMKMKHVYFQLALWVVTIPISFGVLVIFILNDIYIYDIYLSEFLSVLTFMLLMFSGIILFIKERNSYFKKSTKLRIELHSLIKEVNSIIVSKIKNYYDADYIAFSKSKAKQLNTNTSIIFFGENINVIRSWDSIIHIINEKSLNDTVELIEHNLPFEILNYKISIHLNEILGVRTIQTDSILNSDNFRLDFTPNIQNFGEILEITYVQSDQLQRVYLEMNYLKTFQSILRDKIILDPSNQYGDGFQGTVTENELNQLKEIIVNEQQSNDVVSQNTQTYESYLHIVFLAVAILFPFDVLRLLASFAGVVLSLVIIADEKKNSTEKIVSSILIVGYILYALVVINYYF